MLRQVAGDDVVTDSAEQSDVVTDYAEQNDVVTDYAEQNDVVTDYTKRRSHRLRRTEGPRMTTVCLATWQARIEQICADLNNLRLFLK